MRRVGAVLLLALLTAACGGRGGEPMLTAGDARLSTPIAGSAQIALAITNDGTADDELVGVSTPAAAFVEIHETVVTDGRAVMTKHDAVALPAGETVAFRPGSLHLMLLVPDDTVVKDARIPLTLTFRTAADLEVEARVVDLLDLVAFGDELEERS